MRYVIAMLVVLSAMDTRAQSRGSGDGFVAVRVGANVVGNVYRFSETAPVFGAGGSIGTFLSRHWAVEFETWFSGSRPGCCHERHRESIYSLSAVRQDSLGRAQPYLLSGLSLLHTQSNEIQLQVGAGTQVSITGRLSIAVDIRGNGGTGTSMILRPTVAAVYYFN